MGLRHADGLRPVATERTEVLDVAPDRLWEVLEDVSDYPSFWPWLGSFDGRELTAGATWRGVITVAGPLRLALLVHLDEVVPGRSVTAHLGGDLAGRARIDVGPDGDGAALRLVASLVPERPALRALTRVARPVAQASHDRVITRALTQLTHHIPR